MVDLPRPAGPEWFGVYLAGKRVGYANAWVGIENRAGDRVLVARHTTMLSANVGTRDAQQTRTDEKVYEPRPGGRLLAFRSVRTTEAGDFTVEGRCTPGACVAAITSPGGREERHVPAVDETAEQADAVRLAAARRSAVTGRQLDLETLSMVTMEDRYAGTERSVAMGVERDVAVIEEQARGSRLLTRVRVGADGRVLELRMGQIVAKATLEEDARSFRNVALAALTRVTLAAPLPRAVPGSVTFKLRGVPREFQFSDCRQTWTPQPDGTVLLTVTARYPSARDPASDVLRARPNPKGEDPLLSPTLEIDSNVPAIRQAARDIVGNTPGTYAASEKIAHQLFLRIAEANVPPRNRASEVLALRQGGCKERALLFTALARAVGVPARRVHGFVYFRHADGVPALYWSEWVEVRSGQEWIAMDPTLDQPIADATHISFGRDQQVDAVGLLGGVEVLSAEPR